MSSITEALRKTRTDFPIMGEIISWDLHNFQKNKQVFKDHYETLELPDYCYLVKRTRSALTKALKEQESNALIRKIYEGTDRVDFLIVDEEKKVNERDIDFHKRNCISYHKDSKRLEFRAEDSVAEQSLRNSFQRYQDLITGREVSTIFVRLARYAGAITTQVKGGTYFIPKMNLNIIDSMESLLEGTPCSILRLGVLDQKEYKDNMIEQARTELVGEVRKVKRDLKKLSQDEDTFKERVANTRITRISRLSDRINSVEQGLGVEFDNMQKDLRKCRRFVKKRVKTTA